MDHLHTIGALTPKSLSFRYQITATNPPNVLALGHTLCIHKGCGYVREQHESRVRGLNAGVFTPQEVVKRHSE